MKRGRAHSLAQVSGGQLWWAWGGWWGYLASNCSRFSNTSLDVVAAVMASTPSRWMLWGRGEVPWHGMPQAAGGGGGAAEGAGTPPVAAPGAVGERGAGLQGGLAVLEGCRQAGSVVPDLGQLRQLGRGLPRVRQASSW